MAVTQGEALQQPPAPASPGQTPNQPASEAPSPAPVAQAQQRTGGNATQAQEPSPELSFSQIIEQQIAQAIQPVLDEFRQNVAQTMNQQMASASSTATGMSEGMVQPASHGEAVQQPVGQAIQQAPEQQPPQQPPQQSQQQAQPSGPDGQASAQPEGGVQQGLQAHAPDTGALRPALQTVEHQGAQWLQSLLVAGLGALLTESTHGAIQQRAEQGLHALLQKLFDAAPDSVTSPEMQAKTERTLQTILRESLDTIFAAGMRSTVQQGGQQAIQESLHGEFGSALRRVQDTLKAMAEALLTVLRRHWQSVLRLVLALALLALENSMAQSNANK